MFHTTYKLVIAPKTLFLWSRMWCFQYLSTRPLVDVNIANGIGLDARPPAPHTSWCSSGCVSSLQHNMNSVTQSAICEKHTQIMSHSFWALTVTTINNSINNKNLMIKYLNHTHCNSSPLIIDYRTYGLFLPLASLICSHFNALCNVITLHL